MAEVVVLDRVEPGVVPDYCTHGRVTCYTCPEWCWLGDETLKAVQRGVIPVCRQCLVRIAEEQKGTGLEPRLIGNAGDHRRADGPHE